MRIELRKLATHDLSTTYARSMGGNKIKHYKVSHSTFLTAETDPLSLVKLHILKEENKEGSEIEIVETASADLLPPSIDNNGKFALRVEDISETMLASDSSLKKALLKNKSTSLLFETIDPLTFKEKVIDYLSLKLNPLIRKINNVLTRVYNLEEDDIFYGKGRFIPYIYPVHKTHVFNAAHYLSVAFEGPDYVEAQRSLIKDLRLLEDHGLILGHLSMPSLMGLSDMVGSNHHPYVIFCFPIIDYRKLVVLVGEDEAGRPNPLKALGIINESIEGGVNYLNGIPLSEKYQIEVVNVGVLSYEVTQAAVVQAFEESVPTVNKVVEKTRKLIDEHEKARRQQVLEREKTVIAKLNNISGRRNKISEEAKKNTKKVAKKISKKKSTKRKPKKKVRK